jgi:hypothetical protein
MQRQLQTCLQVSPDCLCACPVVEASLECVWCVLPVFVLLCACQHVTAAAGGQGALPGLTPLHLAALLGEAAPVADMLTGARMSCVAPVARLCKHLLSGYACTLAAVCHVFRTACTLAPVCHVFRTASMAWLDCCTLLDC